MLVRAVFVVFVILALFGDARITLFVLNRVVFGSHRHEKNPWRFLIFVVPPVLLFLTALFWPVNLWIERLMSSRIIEQLTPERIEEVTWSLALAKIGSAWLIIAATIGSVWILDRLRLREPRSPREHSLFHNDVYDLEVTSHEVVVDDLPAAFDGYRIAFLTDTHVAGFMRRDYYARIVDEVRRFDPDLILLGGDFVTWRRDVPLFDEVLLRHLRARDGVFAIFGNHDYWADADAIRDALQANGVELLTNRNVILTRGTSQLPLAGIDEMYRGQPDVDAAFRGIRNGRPCIAISHHPDIVDILEGRRIDLLLCGHTHGGQIRVPFFGALVVPSRHEWELAAGFHRLGSLLLYVGRGLGAVPPVRILCRPEVATFVLKR